MSCLQTFDEIAEEVKTVLQENQELSDLTFVNSFRSTKKPNPIRSTYVSIGVSGVEFLDGAFGNYFGKFNNNELIGRNCCVSIGLRIYSSKDNDGDLCCQAFSKISYALILNNKLKGINKISCKEVSFDKSADAFFLDCMFKLNVFVGNSDDEIEISDIIVEGMV